MPKEGPFYRILFMLKDNPGYRGGPVVNAERLLPELAARGIEMHALIRSSVEDPPSRSFFEHRGIFAHVLRGGDGKEAVVKRILEWVEDIRPDVFVPNVSPEGGFASKWVREAGIPCIISHRSDDDRNWGLAKLFSLKKGPWANCHLHCVSDFLRKESEKVANADPMISTIPSGVPLSEHLSDQSSTELRLIYSGRLHQEQKRIIDLIEVLIRVCKARPEKVTASLIGYGEQKEKLQKRIDEEGLNDRIRIYSPLSGEAYHAFLAQHHLLLLLSDYEGMPGAVMDGMACGLVPIVLRMHGIEEIIDHGKNGLILDRRQELLEEGIDPLLEDPEERRRMGQAARETIEEGFSIQVTVERWLAFFEQLIQMAPQKERVRIPEKMKLPRVKFQNQREGPEKPSPWKCFKDRMRLRTRIRQLFGGSPQKTAL